MRHKAFRLIAIALAAALSTASLTACSEPTSSEQEEEETSRDAHSASDAMRGVNNEAMKQIQESKG